VDVDAEYRMEEIRVEQGCEALGQTVGDIRGGSMIVGVRSGDRFQPQPPDERQLRAGDVVVAMGTPRTLERLERLFDAPR
jgi:voltage-gated potassium channel